MTRRDPSLTFDLLCAFMVLGHGRRQLLWFEVTRHPTADWLARQITEAFPWTSAPAYLVRDNDGCGETSKVRIPTEADWILKVMVAMAAADGRLDAREVVLIQKVYKDWIGRSVDVSGVVLAAQAYATKRDVLVELSLAAGSMSRETKEEIVRAAYLTLLADKRIATEERKKLKNVAIALQIPEDQFDAILQATEHTLGGEPS